MKFKRNWTKLEQNLNEICTKLGKKFEQNLRKKQQQNLKKNLTKFEQNLIKIWSKFKQGLNKIRTKLTKLNKI